MLTDQQIDEFLEMLAKSPTSARDMVRGLFAAAAPSQEPAVPLEICPTCGEDRPYTGTCGTSDSDTKALCKRKCKPPQKSVTLTDGLIEKGAMTGMVDAQIDAIVATLREKEQAP